MRIEEVFIDGYGHLHNMNLKFPNGLVCVHGLNETGKSTILAFIRSVFFGFSRALTPTGSRSAPYDPVEGGTKGGYLVVNVPGDGAEKRYRLERVKRAGIDGELIIEDYSRRRTLRGEEAEVLRRELLGGADATLFSNVFALGLNELHNLGSLGQPEVQGILFTADAGLGSGLVHEMERLKDAMGELYLKRQGSRKTINVLNAEIRDLEKQIREAKTDLTSYEPDRQLGEGLRVEREQLDEQRATLYREKELAEQRKRARPVLARLKLAEDELGPLVERGLPSTEDATRESRLQERLESESRGLADGQRRLAEAAQKLGNLKFSEGDAQLWPRVQVVRPNDLDELLRDVAEAQDLREKVSGATSPYVTVVEEQRYRKFDGDRERLEDERAGWQRKSKEAAGRVDDEKAAVLPTELEATARSLQRLDLDALRRSEAVAKERVDAGKQAMAKALAELGPDWTEERLHHIPTDVVGLSNIASQLPGDVEGRAGNVSQYLPLLVIGVLLTASGIAGLLGFFDIVAAGLLAGSGIAVSVYSMILRRPRRAAAAAFPNSLAAQVNAFGLEAPVSRSDFERVASTVRAAADAKRNLSTAQTNLSAIQQQTDAARLKIAGLGAQLGLPMSPEDPGETLAEIIKRYERSASARAKLAQLEQEAGRVAEQAALVDAQLMDAIGEIDELVESRGCTGKGKTDRFEEQIAASRQVDKWKTSLDSLNSQETRFSRLLAALVEIQRERESEEPTVDSFARMSTEVTVACKDASAAHELAENYRVQMSNLAIELKAREAAQEETKRELAELYGRFACSDAEAFHEAFSQSKRRNEIETARASSALQLQDLEAPYPTLRAEIASKSVEEDAEILNTFEDRLSELKGRISKNEADSKEVYARLRMWDSSDRLGELGADVKALEEERDEAITRWTELALTHFLLEETRTEYELKHAPKVLQRAGEFVKTITNDRYEAIVRNTEGDGYELFMTNGKRIPATPPHLSRGVFAQVYLCIRLAYTDVMSAHRLLPFLLDDVLSDFDDERLERGLTVLSGLGKQRQIILLTHHRRILDAAQKAGAAVVSLTPAQA